MGYGDWIFLGALLIVMILGALLGFGKVLSLFVLNKFVRIVLAVFVCYTFGGMILSIPAMNQLLADLASNWASVEFLTKIHLEIIIYYVVLFIITMLIVWIVSKILNGISEIDVLPVKIINKIFGAILLGAFAIALLLLVFQIIGWIGGETSKNFLVTLQTDANAIVRPLYEQNPLSQWVERLIK